MIPSQYLVKASNAPIEAPLGVAVGASLAFAIFAMPAPVFTGIFVADADWYIRLAVVIVAALVAGLATWKLLLLAGKPRIAARKASADLPSIRRADAHPDAPARRPIFAATDLGTALMDVQVNTAPPAKPVRTPIRAVEEEPLELTERAPDEDVVHANPTITALMDRLKTGLERRAAEGSAGVPTATDPLVRGAVEELGRLVGRRR